MELVEQKRGNGEYTRSTTVKEEGHLSKIKGVEKSCYHKLMKDWGK